MRILDVYIIKKFLLTFLMMFLLFIPIGILVDISEKIDKFKEHELSLTQILDYYSDFVLSLIHISSPRDTLLSRMPSSA